MLVHNPRQLMANRGTICTDPLGTVFQYNKNEIIFYKRDNYAINVSKAKNSISIYKNMNMTMVDFQNTFVSLLT